MRALLLGGSGFIGSHLSRQLAAQGAEVMVAADRKLPKESEYGKFKSLKIDLAVPSKKLDFLIENSDTVVIMTQPNYKIIDSIAGGLGKAKGSKKIVYLSSLLVYQDGLEKAGERSPLAPLTDYEKRKVLEEEKLSQLGEAHTLTIARLSNVYGDVLNRGIINWLFTAALEEKPFIINGDGATVRDYIFISDLTAWLEFLISYEGGGKKEIYNLCTGEGNTVNELVEMVKKITNKKFAVKFGPKTTEKARVVGDNNKILKLSGLNSKYDLEGGLEAAYANYLKTGL